MRNDAVERPDPLRKRISQRDQAIARVSRITTATAVAGAMATVGFGGLAAVTYSGDLTNTDTTPITSDGQSTDGAEVTSQATPVPTLSTTRSGTPTVRPPTTTRTRSHVSSGGS
ncbi:MAG TPA: hypothetical protein VH371_09650 [Candidatus Limnocylindrales bacterium]|jgi:hypothetical protein